MSIDDRLTTLDTLWSVWAATGKGLTDADWRLPTRLDGWDLRALWAHSAGWAFGFSVLVGRVTESAPTHDTAAELLAEFNVPDGIANTMRDRMADSGREDASTYTVEQLIDQFATTGPQAIAAARELGEATIDYFGRAVLPLGEVVSIGIVEATVHLLDAQRAVGQAPDVPEPGLAHTVGVLAAIAPPVDFIEAATGRASTELFPVLT